jgi:hypothetical protein
VRFVLEWVTDNLIGKCLRGCDDIPPHVEIAKRATAAAMVTANAVRRTGSTPGIASWRFDNLLAAANKAFHSSRFGGVNNDGRVDIVNAQWEKRVTWL